MIEETPSFNNEIINPNEVLEKITDDVKKNVVKLSLGREFGSGFFCKKTL